MYLFGLVRRVPLTNCSAGELPRVYLDFNPLVSTLETTLDSNDMV